MFNPIEELESIVKHIEGKMPTDLTDYFDEKVSFLESNGINKDIHVGKTDWTRTTASEWLLGQFMGIIELSKENHRHFNAFGHWLKHVYHFVIDNKAGLAE